MQSAPRQSSSVIIIGAGLAGSLLACYLARRNCSVQLIERRADPRSAGFIGGRSINLALSTRGLTALAGVGLDDVVRAEAVAMKGRLMHARDGSLAFQYYSRKTNESLLSVSRSQLNLTLLNAAAAHEDVELVFQTACVSLDVENNTVSLEGNSGAITHATADLIIGADGAYSAVRQSLQLGAGNGQFNFSQSYLDHGYKELTIPPDGDGGFAMQSDALHIWPRGQSMMIALPNADGSFTCTLFWPLEQFAQLDTAAKVEAFFAREYADAVPLIPDLADLFQHNPVGPLVTMRCFPWQMGGRVLLVGDAAHAIVPFYGQGMNAAFEDCRLFDAAIDDANGDLAVAVARFAGDRVHDVEAIADMALDNFIEMRDRTASPWFRLRKRISNFMHQHVGVQSLYHMVTFTNIPYAKARSISQQRTRAAGWVGVVVLMLLLLIIAYLLGRSAGAPAIGIPA
ncbi:MAG: FAD-dependent oxidoreductase [Phycisphaerales bacterium]